MGKPLGHDETIISPMGGIPIRLPAGDTSPGMYYLYLEIHKLNDEASKHIFPIVLIP
jgi:hypothetical protein